MKGVCGHQKTRQRGRGVATRESRRRGVAIRWDRGERVWSQRAGRSVTIRLK